MYNGQFIKGMVHVLIFVILVSVAQHHGVFGIFVFAWIAYQVFDAYQTAKARRDGLPLPDPFGLNDLGAKMGIHIGGTGTAPGFAGTPVPPVPPPPGAGFTPPTAGFTAAPAAGFTSSPYVNVPPIPPMPPPVPGAIPGPVPPGFDPTMMPPPRRREPVGALILIGLGVLFLLNTLDVFHFNWIGHLWPLLIIAIGAGLFYRRTREIQPPPPPPPPSSGGVQ